VVKAPAPPLPIIATEMLGEAAIAIAFDQSQFPQAAAQSVFKY
jgi:hypothetical protein